MNRTQRFPKSKHQRKPLINEYQIIQAIQQGDREAYAELVRRHHAGILRLCLSFLLNLAEAEDAAQEAFLKGFASLHTYSLDGVKARLRRAREALQARARHFSNDSNVKAVGAAHEP